MTAELLIGCGSNRDKKIVYRGRSTWGGLTTLDMNDDHAPDVVWDLSKLPLPFADDSFDEIHAMDVLEHVGTQGDWRFFFDQWSDFWRMLKPGGVFCGICPHPTSPWAYGDPSHTRIVSPHSFVFLNQPRYTSDVGVTPMSDFRFCYEADFDLIHCHHHETTGQFEFVLEAVKPSRITQARSKAA